VVTVEPGIYVPPDLRGVAERWRGIGIRIEDDVAVGADGNVVLTAAVPREPVELERLLGGR
jgi:Xaa-Pro aminopeptidase